MPDALFSLEIPDEDGWRDDLASRVLYVVFAALVFKLGIRLWAVADQSGPAGAIPTALCFVIGIAVAALSVSEVDFHAHGRTIGYLAVAALVLLTLLTSWLTNWPIRLGTDALAFTSYGVELLANGQNPMAASMAPATDLPGAPDRWTWRVDGSKVLSWSYPAGIAWTYLPQYLLIGRGPIGMRLTSILGVGLLGVFMVRALPAVYAPAALVTMVLPRHLTFTAAGGLIDMWWVLPTCVSLVLWYQERYVAAAAALGVAGAMKQQPWVIPPFLAIWLWHERDDWQSFLRLGSKCAAVGLGVFTAINLPFILWDFEAWLTSTMVPLNIGGQPPLVSEGVGLAALSSAGLNIPRTLFKTLVFAGLGLSLVCYYRWFDRLKWAAWLAPQFVLWFAARSLPSYFTWGVPIAMVALFAMWGRLLDDSQPEIYNELSG